MKMNQQTDLFLTPEQLYQVRLVRRWAADFRYAQKVLREGREKPTTEKSYTEKLLEDC